MKTGILIRIGLQKIDLVHLTPRQLLSWYSTLSETSRFNLTEKLLDMVRVIPQ